MIFPDNPRDQRSVAKLYYALQPSPFYAPYHECHQATKELLSVATAIVRDAPASWMIHRFNLWYMVSPPRSLKRVLPTQGWKIHVSATPANCQAILSSVARFLIDNNLAFKFAMDTETLRLLNSKRWNRGGSGKFITIYPISEREFQQTLNTLYEFLKTYIGPYILSDRRYKDCRCLYYRYGTITPTTRIDITGQRRQILVSPRGDEVEDARNPYFALPYWAEDPFEPVEAADGQPDLTLNGGRFSIQQAISLTNTGGVYRATDSTTGEQVIIKEARPLTHVDTNGIDAVARLQHERDMLAYLDSVPHIPKIVTSFFDWENFYVAQHFIPTEVNLRTYFLTKRTLRKVNANVDDVDAFYKDFANIFIQLLRIVSEVHAHGVAIGDLSPRNVLIDGATDVVSLVDFESAYRPSTDIPSDLVTVGFSKLVEAPSGDRMPVQGAGFAGDLYAVGSLMMYAIFPMSTITYVRPDALTAVLRCMVNDTGFGRTNVYDTIKGLCDGTLNCDAAEALLCDGIEPTDPYPEGEGACDLTVGAICHGLGQYLLSVGDSGSRNYLFPADPFMFLTNSLGVGFGATGVMHALLRSGFEPSASLLTRFDAELAGTNPSTLAPGFLTGSSGIAMALYDLREDNQAARFIGAANNSDLRFADHSLYYGCAGIGMANLAAYLRTSDQKYLDEAVRTAKWLMETAMFDERGAHWEANGATYIGLGYGQAGVSLFLLRLSEILSSPSWRELGEAALNYDVSFKFELESGAAMFARTPGENTTYEPYVECGSAGVAKVAIRYGRWKDLEPLLMSVYRKYAGFVGLIYGTSGFIDVLVDAFLFSGDTKYLRMAERPVSGVADLYLMKRKCGYAVPGEGLIRISCDYATGVAGVMRALYRLQHLVYSDYFLDNVGPGVRAPRDSGQAESQQLVRFPNSHGAWNCSLCVPP